MTGKPPDPTFGPFRTVFRPLDGQTNFPSSEWSKSLKIWPVGAGLLWRSSSAVRAGSVRAGPVVRVIRADSGHAGSVRVVSVRFVANLLRAGGRGRQPTRPPEDSRLDATVKRSYEGLTNANNIWRYGLAPADEEPAGKRRKRA